MPRATAPLCINCVHCVGRSFGPPSCTSPRISSGGTSPVDGKPRKPVAQCCETLRMGWWIDAYLGRTCGPQGRWFEPKAEKSEAA